MPKAVSVRGFRAHRSNIRNRVGNFGHHLCANLIDGRVIAHELVGNTGPSRGDVENDDLQVRGESKARDNNHPFGVRTDQLAHYQHSELVVPKWRYFYSLISYRNREWKKRGQKYHHKVKGPVFSPLARLSGTEEQFRFIASKIDGVYLVDLHVMAAARKLYMVRRGLFLNDVDTSSITLRRSDIRQLCFPNALTFEQLGLEMSDWVPRRFDTRLTLRIGDRTYFTRFPLYTLLDRELDERLCPVLRSKSLDDDVPF